MHSRDGGGFVSWLWSGRPVLIALLLVALQLSCGRDEPAEDLSVDGEPEDIVLTPLEEELGYSLEEPRASVLKRLGDVQACMADNEFEYVAWLPPSEDEIRRLFVGNGDRDSVAEWGFGASTLRFSSRQVGGDLKGFPSEGFDELLDPNEEIIESLSVPERAEYARSLLDERDGCFQQASSPHGERLAALAEAFGEELSRLEIEVDAAPEVLAFEAEVGACLAEVGLEWTNRDQARERFLAWSSTLAATGVLTEDDRQRLAEIQGAEIELALAEFDCGGRDDVRQAVRSEARDRLEREFVEANQTRLSAHSVEDG